MIADLKPYAEYKESGLPWLGRVPGHWEVRQARHIGRLLKGVGGTKEDAVAEGMPCIRYGELYTTYTYFIRASRTFIKPERVAGYMTLQYGDVLFAASGETIEDIGKSAVNLMRTPAVCGGKATMARGTTVKHIYPDELRTLLLALPPPAEQAAIVRFLDWANGRLDRAIQAKRKVIGLLNEQKQAIIHRAVTRGLDPSSPLKPSGIPWLGDIPAHWEMRPLKAVCEIQSGITLGKDYAGQVTQEYPYLRVANVQAGHTNLSVVKKIRVTRTEALRCMLQKGDVLMTEGGDPDKLGRGCVWDAQVAPCLHQNHVFAVRPNQSKLEPHFLSALMGTRYARAYFESTAKQTTNLASTNKTKIGQFEVLLPTMDEQKNILTALDDEMRPVNTTISRLNREIELLREYRTRLVADVVTGKLDARAAAARLPAETDTPEPLDAADLDELADAIADGDTEA